MTLYIMQHQPPVVLISERWYTYTSNLRFAIKRQEGGAPNSRVEVIKLLEETAVANRKIINLLEETG